MPHPTGPTNQNVREIISKLQKTGNKDIARYLSRPARSKKPVNLRRLSRLAKKYDTMAVPGKVLGIGSIGKPVEIYALSFSKSAKSKIEKAGGKALPLSSVKEKAKLVV